MMKKYVEYLGSKAEGAILSHGLGDWFDLGPNPPGPSQLTPLPLTATAIYYHDLTLLARMARLLGREGDAAAFAKNAEAVKAAFIGRFFNPETSVYATGSQTSYAMPLSLGMADERSRKAVFDNLVRSIREGGNALTAGDIGFHFLVKALEEGGASDLIYEMNSRSDVPGYGYQLRKGATALTESWPAREDVSNNHMMLGHIMEWFYSGLAGIRQAENSTGFEKVIVAPNPVGDITWAEASFRSPYGEIISAWKRDGGKFSLDVAIPANARATVLLPARSADDVSEGGAPLIWETQKKGERNAYPHSGEKEIVRSGENIKLVKMEDGRAVIEIGSGRYHFETVWPGGTE
jgi:hypothetical protein